jgi:hypothetical protein
MMMKASIFPPIIIIWIEETIEVSQSFAKMSEIINHVTHLLVGDGHSGGQAVERFIPPPAPTSESEIFG